MQTEKKNTQLPATLYLLEFNNRSIVFMGKFKDIIGQKFGRLTVIKLHHVKRTYRNFYYYLCKCECGKEHIVLKSSLLNGLTRSCGCYNNEVRIAKCKARAKHHMSETRLFKVWEKMKGRCFCKTRPDYKHYGGRGITLCKEWQDDFINFYSWAMANGYNPNAKYGECTIDRINVNGNYEPENCRWVNEKIQQRNRRNNRLITYNGETHCLSEWAEIYNMRPALLSQRMKRDKKTFEQAIQK